jgi:hypothetical protein
MLCGNSASKQKTVYSSMAFVRLDVSELRPPTGLLFISQMIYGMSMESRGGMILTGEIKELGEKSVPVSLCPPQITH